MILLQSRQAKLSEKLIKSEYINYKKGDYNYECKKIGKCDVASLQLFSLVVSNKGLHRVNFGGQKRLIGLE